MAAAYDFHRTHDALRGTLGANRKSKAFTLIELLTIVVLMSILTSLMVQRFSATTAKAKKAALVHNLAVLRSQLELYQNIHHGKNPEIRANKLPQLTHATNAAGEIGMPGPGFPFGPYLYVLPENCCAESNEGVPVAVPGKVPTGVVGTTAGWQYDETTGNIWPNNPDFFE